MIPVMYIHFGAFPQHLKISINQALKYNNKVIVITDVAETIVGAEIFNVKHYIKNVNDFTNSYQHMSTNSKEFEIICIKRWIILANYLHQHNISVCYYSDSDVMLYENVDTIYKYYQDFDACYTLPLYQENYRWTASACCSFWKKETLKLFSEYILKSYASPQQIEQLKEKWNYHQQHNVAGGICDMTLLYLFSKTINFKSLSQTHNGIAFDQNYTDNENYYKNEYELVYSKRANRGVKKIDWKNNLPFSYNLIEKKEIKFIALTEYARFVNINNSISFKIKTYRFIKKIQNRLTHFFITEKPHGWFGNYTNWQEAAKECEGYDATNILDTVKTAVLKVRNGKAVYERDSVLFNEIQHSPNLINAFNQCIDDTKLHIIDFGGSLGSSYFQHKELYKHIPNLKWAVVEQKHFVDCGKKEIEIDNLRFYYTIEEALNQQTAHVLFLSSVIPYFEKPYELIVNLLNYNFEHIIVDRTFFIEDENNERITKQIVPEFIYKASYPAWFLNEKKFINAFLNNYNLIIDFESAFDADGKLEDGKRVYRKGFYFKRKC